MSPTPNPDPSKVPIRILHLSDFHFSDNKAWDSDPVMNALARHIGDEVAKGLKPDLVAITGDLAFSGKAEEYAAARTWLQKTLWPQLDGLHRNRLLLVPGNHDVARKAVKRSSSALHSELLAERSQQLIAEVLGDADERAGLLRRHEGYQAFCKTWPGMANKVTGGLPWWQRRLSIRDQPLHIIGLDSAWLASGDDDYGRLLLSRYQVNQLLFPKKPGKALALRIALLHHPWSYLAEFDQNDARALIHQHCDLVLRGHLHQTRTERIVPPAAGRACLELAAGCVYEAGNYPNAYQWVEIQPDTQTVTVRFRTWNQHEWMPDRNIPGCPEAQADYPLKIEGQPVTEAGPDFGRYLDDLIEDTAYIEIRGLVTGNPDAHRFPIQDLYIELSASGGGRAGTLYAALAHSRLVIIGDPGAGKTTFLRWVAHTLAADRSDRAPGAANTVLALDRARLPLLVRIADWLEFHARLSARNEGPALAAAPEWLAEYLGQTRTDLEPAAFEQLLEAGDALILFDGLDEAPDPRRRVDAVRLIEAVARAYPTARLVVTSRPAAYRDQAVLANFSQTRIDALDTDAIHGFLQRWSRALFPKQPARAEAHRQALQAALEAQREIRRMARNTVMLTALAVVHWNQKRLPEQRAELYEAIIKWLAEARDRRPGRQPAQRCRQLLAELALVMQLGDSAKDGDGRVVQVERRRGAEWLAAHFETAPGPGETWTGATAADRAEAFLADEELDSGIIVRRGNQLRFWHLTFQEYLAAQAIAGRSEQQQQALLLGPERRLYTPEWRETVLLLGGVLYQQGFYKVDGLILAVLDQLDHPVSDEAGGLLAQARCAGLLGALVRDLKPYGYRPADLRYAQVLTAAMAVFDPEQAPAIPIPDRIAAADALAQAGDPRLGWLTPGRWVVLDGGRFAMGAQKTAPKGPNYDDEAIDNEAPVHSVEVSAFRIARFPVTVFEYAEFIDDDGYADEQWWSAGGFAKQQGPEDWDVQQDHPSRPVSGVCWHEAAAFCAWLDARLKRPQGTGEVPCPAAFELRLPTEAEWEFAARGSEGRRYPWGNELPDKERANFSKVDTNAPSPVGVFPGDSTPEGVLDMAGNVWEWCRDGYQDDYYQRCRDQGVVTNPQGGDGAAVQRVLRGGTFYYWVGFLRAAVRGRDQPVNRDQYIGFRCVLAPRRQL